MKTYKSLIYILLTILMVSSVLALDWSVKSDVVKDKITLEGIASYDLHITNNADFTQKFSIKTLDFPIWDAYTKPVVNPITLSVGPGETDTIRIYVDPLHITSIGTFDVNMRVKSETTQTEDIIPLRVAVVSQGSLIGGYVPTVTATINMPSEINPKDTVPISVTIKNQNPIEYPNLIVGINGNIFNKEIKTSLGSKKEKTLDFSTRLDPLTKPQKDTLFLTVKSNNLTITGPLTKGIRIISYSDLIENVTQTNAFLKSQKDIKLTNSGNEAYSGAKQSATTFFKMLFTTTQPKARLIKENGKRYFTWDINLAPNESTEIKITENYLPFIIILILIGALIFLYVIFRKPLTISKVAANVETREGGLSNLKIVITLKNRGKVALKDIKVIDKIPNIADIERELTIGTLQPSKILKHEEKGSILKWNVDSLEIGEERVISYRIKPILSIVGDFSLLPATGSYILKGKKHKVKSNSLNINS